MFHFKYTVFSVASENETVNTFSLLRFSFFLAHPVSVASKWGKLCRNFIPSVLRPAPVISLSLSSMSRHTTEPNTTECTRAAYCTHTQSSLFIGGTRAEGDYENDFAGEASWELGDIQQQIFENTTKMHDSTWHDFHISLAIQTNVFWYFSVL